jgi:ABC-type sugar transport system ATPase subunit
MSKIFLQNLQKKYGQVTALDDLTLQINDKELIVLLGPSGCGKTTVLNCIAGIEEPTRGRIFFDDNDVTGIPPHTRNIAMVFQSALLYPHLTARENIRMSLRILSKRSKEEKENRVKEVANLLGIIPLLDKSPFEMSGGERQRVAIAKAIVRNPSVFLMDEPLSSLDAARREAIRFEIVVLQQKLANTMVFVTHDQVEAMTLGDRIAVMELGKLQQVGTPDEIYNNPINTFVGGFVGSPPMNFFQGVIRKKGDEYIFDHPRFHVALSKEFINIIKGNLDDKSVILGVRPQHMTLFRTRKDGALKGSIYGVERLGKETIGIIQYDDDNKFKVIVDPSFKLSIGDVVFSIPQNEHLYFFNSSTKMNIFHQ